MKLTLIIELSMDFVFAETTECSECNNTVRDILLMKLVKETKHVVLQTKRATNRITILQLCVS